MLPIAEVPHAIAPGFTRERDQLLQVLRRHAGMNDGNARRRDDMRDGRKILDRVVRQLRIECGPGAEIGDVSEHERVAVRRRARDDLHADSAVAAGSIVDDDLLVPCFGQLLRDQARDDVCTAPGYEWHHQTYRSIRIFAR